MPKLSVNLSMLYPDSPFIDRFARAHASGFRFVEYMFPYDYDLGEQARILDRLGLEMVLFNLPAGNFPAGDRGIAAHPDRIDEYRRGVDQAIDAARTLKCRLVNCLVGKQVDGVPYAEHQRVMVENLRYTAQRFADAGLTLLLEPLNPYDTPGFVLTNSRQAWQIQDEVGAPNLKVQYDIYHMQRVEGELAATMQANLARIGHIQLADNPGRHEPGSGEINYRFLLPYLDQIGYDGYVGLEYRPAGNTEDGLSWIADHGLKL
jgi:hydroxypyruvate isomerase